MKFYRVVLFLLSIVVCSTVLLFEKYKVNSTNEFVIFNQNKNSLVISKQGTAVSVFSSDLLNSKNYDLQNYLLKRNLNNVNISIKQMQQLYSINDQTILVIDSLGLYKFKTIKPSIILLRNSPKINLERMIDYYAPIKIVADGSNYKSYLKKWEQSCIKTKTPFYNTMQKGAFILEE